MKITNDEKLEMMKKMLWDFKMKIVDIDFTIRFNEGMKIKNPNSAIEIDKLRLKLDSDRRQAVRLAEKLQFEINQLKLKPLDALINKNSDQEEK